MLLMIVFERVSLAGLDSRVDSDCRAGLRYAVAGQAKYARDSAYKQSTPPSPRPCRDGVSRPLLKY